MWDKAQNLARSNCPEMLSIIEERQRTDLLNQGDPDALLRKTGDMQSTLEMYARQGQWQPCPALAEKQGDFLLGEVIAVFSFLIPYFPRGRGRP